MQAALRLGSVEIKGTAAKSREFCRGDAQEVSKGSRPTI
jgi:hypothetical protein